MIWQLKTKTLTLQPGLPVIMGIVNVTPDSFSDGGQHNDVAAAVDHAMQLARDGARILDIGGESTRPYSDPVGQQEEMDRVLPVIERLAEQLAEQPEYTDVAISVDTSKSAVAAAAIAAGAEIINDVTGLEGDREMMRVAVASQAGVCAMHMQGTPQTMQDDPHYDDVTADILNYLQQRKQQLLDAGIVKSKICLDPGIGFGKTHDQNIELINNAHRFLETGCPILIGHSRKGFIGKLIGDPKADRDAQTLALTLQLARQGIHVIRVHEVANTVRVLM